jgi:hypothetical protein
MISLDEAIEQSPERLRRTAEVLTRPKQAEFRSAVLWIKGDVALL